MDLVKIKKNFHRVAAFNAEAEFKEVSGDKPRTTTLKLKSGSIPVVIGKRGIPVSVRPQLN